MLRSLAAAVVLSGVAAAGIPRRLGGEQFLPFPVAL